MLPAMPLQQISVTPLDWQKDCQRASVSEHSWKSKREPVYTATAAPERCTSQASTLSNNCDICRICHCEGEADAPLIAPCYCSGSLRYVHQACLQQWIKSSDIRCCELCKFEFIMQSKVKPFMQWELLELSSLERRRLFCSVVFHSMAIICVLWSLYVLVDRTLAEVNTGSLEWPFWTKLIIVAVGFTGGIVFVSVQCRGYVQLCRRWRAFNRVIYVQNAPEKAAFEPSPSSSLVMTQESLLMSGTSCVLLPVEVSAAGPCRSASAMELSEEAKPTASEADLPSDPLAPFNRTVSATHLNHVRRQSDVSLENDPEVNDLSDIAPPPAAFSDSVDDADPPSPTPDIASVPSPSQPPIAFGSALSFPLNRLGSTRLSPGYPLLLSTFHPSYRPEPVEGSPSTRSRTLSSGDEVTVTIRPWTVGGSYFLHPAQSCRGATERWLESSRGTGDTRRVSLPVDAIRTDAPSATITTSESTDGSMTNARCQVRKDEFA